MSGSEPSLRGRTFVITRPAEESGELAGVLRGNGATVYQVPAIAIEPLASTEELRAAATRLRLHPAPRWLAVTSANAVKRLGELRLPQDLDGVRIAAIGGRTASALRGLDLEVDLVASSTNAAALGRDLVDAGAGHGAAWLPQAEAARPELAETLGSAGARLEITPCYRTVSPVGLREGLVVALADDVDGIIVFSGSAVENVVEAVGAAAFGSTCFVCVGAGAAQAAGRHRLTSRLLAPSNHGGIAQQLAEIYGRRP